MRQLMGQSTTPNMTRRRRQALPVPGLATAEPSWDAMDEAKAI